MSVGVVLHFTVSLPKFFLSMRARVYFMEILQ